MATIINKPWSRTLDEFFTPLDEEIGWTDGNDVMMVAKFVSEAIELPDGEPERGDWVRVPDLLWHWQDWAKQAKYKHKMSATELGRLLREVNREEFEKRCRHFRDGHRYFVRLKETP